MMQRNDNEEKKIRDRNSSAVIRGERGEKARSRFARG